MAASPGALPSNGEETSPAGKQEQGQAPRVHPGQAAGLEAEAAGGHQERGQPSAQQASPGSPAGLEAGKEAAAEDQPSRAPQEPAAGPDIAFLEGEAHTDKEAKPGAAIVMGRPGQLALPVGTRRAASADKEQAMAPSAVRLAAGKAGSGTAQSSPDGLSTGTASLVSTWTATLAPAVLLHADPTRGGTLALALTVLLYVTSSRGRGSDWHLSQQCGDLQAGGGKAVPAASSGQAAGGQQPAPPAPERAAPSQSAGSVNGRQSSFNDALYGSHPSATGGVLQMAASTLHIMLCSLAALIPGGMPAQQMGPCQVTVAAQGCQPCLDNINIMSAAL